MRELGLANRRKYRMSGVHACVGSFGVITRVCQMGGEGHFGHLTSPPTTEPQNRWISLGGRWRRYPPFLLKYWFLARRPFCEKCSFFPYCYGQFSVIFCALFASASGKKTIARVTRIGKICRILFDILTPDRLYSSWMSLPFVDFFALGASFFDQK